MSQWSSPKAKRVLAALLRIGWSIKRESSSHKILSRPGSSDVVFAFHDKDEIGPEMLAALRSIRDSKRKTCRGVFLIPRAAQRPLGADSPGAGFFVKSRGRTAQSAALDASRFIAA